MCLSRASLHVKATQMSTGVVFNHVRQFWFVCVSGNMGRILGYLLKHVLLSKLKHMFGWNMEKMKYNKLSFGDVWKLSGNNWERIWPQGMSTCQKLNPQNMRGCPIKITAELGNARVGGCEFFALELKKSFQSKGPLMNPQNQISAWLII